MNPTHNSSSMCGFSSVLSALAWATATQRAAASKPVHELEPIASSKQAVLARSLEGTEVQEDQTSATAAAAAPQVLAVAVAPIVVKESEPEDNGLDVRVRGHAKAAGGTKVSMKSMLPRMLVQALQAHQGWKPCRNPKFLT